jgi:hypothetical protein
MGATVLVSMLATGLGLIAGGYYSVLGWAAVGSLLFITTLVALIAAGVSFAIALGWIALTLFAFNIGLVVTLIVRTSAQPQRA